MPWSGSFTSVAVLVLSTFPALKLSYSVREPPPLEDKDLVSEDEPGEVEKNGADVIEEDGPEASETTIQDIDIGVHPVPKGSDGEV